jgi:dienelactone hydrolase
MMGHSENFHLDNFELAGSLGELIDFPSANPVNYAQVVTNRDDIEEIEISGKLFTPNSSNLLPAVVIVPGSLGVSDNHLAHAETMVNAGFAAFVIDPFTNRQVESTVMNQTQYSFAASAFDVLAALRALGEHPQIDADRISAQGHSRGGTAVLFSSMRTFADPIVGSGCSFRGVYAVYPWCGHQFFAPNTGATKIRAIVGERDDWLSVQQVQSQIQAIKLSGGTASIRIVKGAAHSFDREEVLHEIPEASVTPQAPTVYLDPSGRMIHPVIGTADVSLTDKTLFVVAVEAGFGRRGAHIGGTEEQNLIFQSDMLRFHQSVLVK